MGHVESHVGKGIPKVKDKLVTLNIVAHDGAKHVVQAYEGEPLLLALKRNSIPIGHACNGGDMVVPYTEPMQDNTSWGPSCSECQIVVGEAWFKHLKPMGEHEKTRLLRTHTNFVTPLSRLACCLMVEKWMNGIHLSIPYIQESRPIGTDGPFEHGENRIHRY
jgi:ferredoxin